MEQEYVTVRGQKFYVVDGELDLSSQEIERIDELIGLEFLTTLELLDLSNNLITVITGLDSSTKIKELYLDNNQIVEITGLKALTNLEGLSLAGNKIRDITGLETSSNLIGLILEGNKITEIKGLGNLSKLEGLILDENPIPTSVLDEITSFNKEPFAQQCVQYCRLHDLRAQEKGQPSLNQSYGNHLQKFEKIMEISQEVKISTVAKSLEITESELFEKLLVWGEKLPFKIKGDLIIVENLNLFIQSLDMQFSDWEHEKLFKSEKI